MKKKNKLEKSRFILSIVTPSVMLLHMIFLSLIFVFQGALIVVGPFYLPVFSLHFIYLVIPFEKISKFRKLGKVLFIAAMVLAMVISLLLLFFAVGGAFMIAAISHGVPVIRLLGCFYNFIIISFSTIAMLILSLLSISILSIFIHKKSNIEQGEQKDEFKK